MSGILNNVYNNAIIALGRHAEALMKLQEQASTGSRVNRPSDDSSTAYHILTLNSETSSLENYISTLNDTSSMLQVGSSIIGQMASAVSEARVSVTQITSGIYNQEGRDRAAEAIDNVLEQLVQLANTKHNGQYLFGGSDTGTAPFAVERTDGEITAVTYQGSSEDRNIDVASEISSSAFYVGQELFRSDQRGEPVFTGDSGAAAGTGTSSVTGDVWLTVTFDGSNYQISIDDGATFVTVPAGGDVNQAVTDSRTGKVLYVDTTGINSTGVELVRVPGTYDVFGSLIEIRNLMRNDRNLSDEQLEEFRNVMAGSLEEIQNLLAQKQTSMGLRVGFLEGIKNGLEDVKLNTENQTTQLEEADITQVAIDLSRHEVLYQMSLAVAGKLMSLSLLDFIE
jgi:flagellar hook-associated protein 3 FlgL